MNEHGVTHPDEWADGVASWPDRRCAMARLARAKWRSSGSKSRTLLNKKIEPAKPDDYCHRMNPVRISSDGAAAVSRVFQFYVQDGEINRLKSPMQPRILPWRAVQHRVVFAAHDDGGEGLSR